VCVSVFEENVLDLHQPSPQHGQSWCSMCVC